MFHHVYLRVKRNMFHHVHLQVKTSRFIELNFYAPLRAYFFVYFFFLFFILHRYKFLNNKFTNSTMKLNSYTN